MAEFQPVRIEIIGAGSIGMFLAASLSRQNQVPIRLIARDESVPRIRAKNWTWVEPDGKRRDLSLEIAAWSEVSHIEARSILIFATKVFSLKDAISSARERMSQRDADESLLVLAQNGLGVAEAGFGRAICWLGARLDAASFELKVAGVGSIELGGGDPLKMQVLRALFEQVGIAAHYQSDARVVEWQKALWNVTTNGLCAILGVPNGVAAQNPRVRALAERLYDEAARVARAEGISLPSDMKERVFASTLATASNRNSTLEDLTHGRRTEIEWLNGAVIRAAARHGLEVPGHQWIYELVKAREEIC